MNNIYERGSEWRKWDLHIHTPASFFWTGGKQLKDMATNEKEESMKSFIKAVNDSDVATFCIMDYWTFDWCIDLIKHNKQYPEELKKSVLSGMELRVECPVDYRLNIHVILSSTLTEQQLNDFKSELKIRIGGHNKNLSNDALIEFAKTLGEDKARVHGYDNPTTLTNDKLLELGSKTAEVTKDSLKKAFEHIPENSGYVVLPYDTSGGLSELDWSRHPQDDNYFMQTASIFEARDQKNIDLFQGKETEDNKDFFKNFYKTIGSKPKPCVSGSDAHKYSDYGQYPSDKITWIKADPTFEGLKQILHEPTDRVRIQANKPEEKSGYHVIKSIEINDVICKQTILLNPNLNAVIGGRSTGKSTLLQLIAYRVNPNIADIKEFITNIPQDSIKITWQDNEENKNRDIEFFPQSHMYEIARKKEKKNKLIQEIVEEKDNESLIRNYEKFCNNNKSTLQANIDDLFKLQNGLSELTMNLKEKGDESGLRKEIESLQKKIKDSHQDESFSEGELNKFEELRKKILELEQFQQKLEKDKNEIANLKDENLFDTSFGYKFNQLSELTSKAIQEIFDSVKQQAIEQWQDKLSEKLTKIDALQKKYKNDIKEKIESNIYKKGKAHLEQNKQYKELNDRLSIENKKLSEIISIQTQINKVSEQKKTLFDQTIENHIAYTEKIDKLIYDFSLVHDDIEIKIEKLYRDDKCKELLKDFINLQSYDRQNFVNNWGVSYEADIKSKVAEFLQQALENKIELKSLKDIKDLTKGLLTENWFLISYELTYQHDTFDKMSDGKKAFVILKLLLEFSNKECPILIDQPEDSLDNRAIYNELVTYLKKKKKERQIILVTHNANIVVNADAEEVIVANQHGEDSKNQDDIKFQYISGSLENTILKNPQIDIVLQSQGTREHACEILEGGTEAFKKRENKYAIGDSKWEK